MRMVNLTMLMEYFWTMIIQTSFKRAIVLCKECTAYYSFQNSVLNQFSTESTSCEEKRHNNKLFNILNTRFHTTFSQISINYSVTDNNISQTYEFE